VKIRSSVWLDANGYTRIQMLRTDTGAGAIDDDVEAISNAVRTQCWEGPQQLGSGTATAALYQSSSQVVRLTFLCADGTLAEVKVFAPVSTIFLADGVTVDITNAGVVLLAVDAVGNLESASGSKAVSLLSGLLEGVTT
jgi:hypothetical protein